MSPTVYAGQPSHVHVRDMSRGQARYIVNKRENVEAAWPVRATGVRKRFHGVDALRGVDLEVAPGEIHGLLGPNGAGKTTLLRVLFGLIRPDGGEVRLFGREHRAGGAAQALQGVAGFVDRPRYYPYLTARQTLLMLATMDGHRQHPDIDALLECVDLLPLAGRRLAGWSTGMLQRLGVAAALMRSPRLLILDEPAEGLDPAGARDLRDLLRALSSSGVAILLSSHDMPEVEDICHTLTILNGGTVARRGSIEELRASSPAASHRITTSDDRRAARLALDHGLATEADAGVLLVTADPGQLDAFVCALGKADVAVRGINRGLDPLSALFFQLTETPPPTEPALSASP